MRIEYRASARADLNAIAIYTKQEWGLAKARQYLRQLQVVVSSLSEFPNRFPSHNSRHGQFRKVASGEHFIFYVVFEDRIEIVRVLHKGMNVDQIL